VKRITCFIRAIAEDGQPLAETRFSVEQAEGPVPELMYVTDAAGVARLGLPPGRVVLRFFLADRGTGTAEFSVVNEPGRTYEACIKITH
jgi:hypothetical protein